MRKAIWVVAIIGVVLLSFAIALAAYAQVSAFNPRPGLRLGSGDTPLLRAQAANPLAARAAPVVAAVSQPASRVQAQPPAADAILQDSLMAMAGLDSWHVESGMDVIASFRSIAMEAPVSYSGDFQAPDRIEGVVSVNLLGLTLEKDTVFLANTRQDSDDAGVTAGGLFSLLSFGRFDTADIRNLELVGEETLEGTQVYHLQGELTADREQPPSAREESGFQGAMQFDAWIGVDDSLLRQVMADGQLTAWGPAVGTLQIGASATFSDFGQPLAAAPPAPVPAPEDGSCAAGDGFVAYRNQAQGIRFCYPAGWVVNDLTATHGFIAVSPHGVGYGRPLPKSLFVIYPPATVSGFGTWQVGAVEVLARPAVAFYGWIRQTLQPGQPSGNLVLNFETIARIGQWILSDGPLVGGLTGTEDSGGKAVSLGGTVEGDTQRAAVEAILSSVVVEGGASD